MSIVRDYMPIESIHAYYKRRHCPDEGMDVVRVGVNLQRRFAPLRSFQTEVTHRRDQRLAEQQSYLRWSGSEMSTIRRCARQKRCVRLCVAKWNRAQHEGEK